MVRAGLAVVLTAGLAAPVYAKPPLRDVAEIDDGIFAIALADRIRKACPDISARMVKAFLALQGLQNRARELGYSDDEIEAYTDSDAEKARMRVRGAEYFAERGLPNDGVGACALGRQEIAAQSAVGVLLRAKN